jgi:hypothetical protein
MSGRFGKFERGFKQMQMKLGLDNVSVVDSDFAGSVDTTIRRNVRMKQWLLETERVVEREEEEEDLDADRDAARPPSPPAYEAEPTEGLPGSFPSESNERYGYSIPSHPNGTTVATPPSSTAPLPEARYPSTIMAKVKSSLPGLASGGTINERQPQPIHRRPLTQTLVTTTMPPHSDFDKGQFLRKTIVSREALHLMGIRYQELGKYVYLDEEIDAANLQVLRDLSEQRCANRKLWWGASNSTPSTAAPAGPLARQRLVKSSGLSRPVKGQQTQDAFETPRFQSTNEPQHLRKTIVSRYALNTMAIPYSENGKHVILARKLDGETVQMLRDISQAQSSDVRSWW